jgi:hypothetical protein
MDDFNLHIEMGNDAMSTLDDIAEALEHAADRLRSDHRWSPDDAEGSIVDRNGNTVGNWKVS